MLTSFGSFHSTIAKNGGNAVPLPPTNLIVSNVTSGTVTISFTPSPGTIIGYIATTNNGAQGTGVSSPITISGLGANTTFTVTVVAFNLNGTSNRSSSVTVTTSPGYLFYSDGSTLSGWTVGPTPCTISTTVGNPVNSIQANGNSAYAYYNLGYSFLNTTITFDVYVGTLCDFFFACNSTGSGQFFRAEGRGNGSGFASTNAWTSWSGGGGGIQFISNTWYSVKIVISSGGVASWYRNNVLQSQTRTITNNGTYFGLQGDGGGGISYFDNIIINSNASGSGGSSSTTNTGIPNQPIVTSTISTSTTRTLTFVPPVNVTTGSTYSLFYGSTIYGTATFPATTIVATGLLPNTTYNFFITATNSFGTSAVTSTLNGLTSATLPVYELLTNTPYNVLINIVNFGTSASVYNTLSVVDAPSTVSINRSGSVYTVSGLDPNNNYLLNSITANASGFANNALGQLFNTSTMFTVATGASNPSFSYYGQYICIGCSSNGIYVSTNYGNTFTKIVTEIYAGQSAISDSGKYMYVACNTVGRIYYSSNYGTSFTSVNVGANIGGIACSASGSNVYITDGTNGGIYYSTNFGTSWSTLVTVAANLANLRSNYSGSTVYFTSTTTGKAYAYILKTNSVVLYTIGGGANVSGIAVSTNGQYMYVSNYGGQCYLSNNAGSSFTVATSLVSSNYANISCDVTGQYVYVHNATTSLYYSSDYGATFATIIFPTSINVLSLNRNSCFLGIVSGSGLYISTNSFLLTTAPLPPTDLNTVSKSVNTLVLGLTPPSGNAPVKKYLSLTDPSGSTGTGTGNTYTLSNLINSTNYSVYLSTVNAGGTSAYSTPLSVTTISGGSVVSYIAPNISMVADASFGEVVVSTNSYTYYVNNGFSSAFGYNYSSVPGWNINYSNVAVAVANGSNTFFTATMPSGTTQALVVQANGNYKTPCYCTVSQVVTFTSTGSYNLFFSTIPRAATDPSYMTLTAILGTNSTTATLNNSTAAWKNVTMPLTITTAGSYNLLFYFSVPIAYLNSAVNASIAIGRIGITPSYDAVTNLTLISASSTSAIVSFTTGLGSPTYSSSIGSGSGTPAAFTITGLTANIDYSLNIVSSYVAGYSVYGFNNAYSMTSPSISLKTALLPPTIIDVSNVTTNSALLRFTAPSGAGSGAIYSAIIGGVTYATVTHPVTSIALTDLSSNTSYPVSMTIGTSSLSNPLVFATVALAPIGLTASAVSDTAAGVTITPPPGTSAITQYIVTSSPDNIVGTGSGPNVTVSGLNPSTDYTFTATATNASNVPSASTVASNTITTYSVPGPPTNLAVVSTTSNSITISFTLIPGNIFGYIATTGTGEQGTSTSSPITIYGLGSNATYSINIVAISANGTSVNSNTITATTPIFNATLSIPSFQSTDISGTAIDTGKTYNVYVFKNTSAPYTVNYNLSYDTSMNILVVGGGGGGGSYGSGGGGGGGVAIRSIVVPAGSNSMTINIGVGGTGAAANSGSGGQGRSTTVAFNANSSLNITTGGGSGGCAISTPTYTAFGSGGGGGASGGYCLPTSGNTNGGTVYANNGSAAGGDAGGGGGAGTAGGTASSRGITLAGGDGIQCNLPGIRTFIPSGTAYGTYYWAGGGGGASGAGTAGGGGGGRGGGSTTGGTGGLNLGGNSAGGNSAGGAGGVNTGGGGGGNWTNSSGGNGGSGIVIIVLSGGGSATATNTGIPVQPVIGLVASDNTSFTVNFTPPNSATTGSTYRIYYGSTTYGTATYPATTIVASGLTPNTQYSFYLSVTNAFGASLPTSVNVVYTTMSAPTSLIASLITTSSCSIGFTAPSGTAIGTTYNAVVGTAIYATASYPATTIALTYLSSNTSYSFYMTTTNAYGTSVPSSTFQVLTLPIAPTDLSAMVINNVRVSVAFTPSTGTITGYVVRSNPGNVSASGSSSPIIVSGLIPNTSYTFTATATNSTVTSASSTPSSAVVTNALPNVPTNLVLVGTTPNSATIGFTPPVGTLLYYIVTTSDGLLYYFQSSPIVVPGLLPETVYTATIQSVDSYGGSIPSDSISFTTPATVTGTVLVAPTNLTATSATTTSIIINFTAPSGSTNGTTYIARIGSIPYGAAVYPATAIYINGLTPNMTYPFTLVATNQYGSSVASAPITVITVPLPPTGITTLVTNNSVSVGFNYVSGNATISNYTVKDASGAFTVNGTTSPIVVTSLSSATLYNLFMTSANSYPTVVNSTFSVKTITGLLVWLDATDNSTITSSSGNVTTWSDKSSNGYNFITYGTSPKTGTISINGLNTIDFGGNTGLYNATIPFGTSYTIFAIGYTGNTNTYARLFHGTNGDGKLLFGGLSGNFATFVGNGGWNDINVNSPTTSVTTTSLMCMTTNNTGSGLLPYINGTSMNAKNGITVTFTGLYVANFSGGQLWNGPMGETIIYNNVLSVSDREKVEGYLAWKWGIQSKLPTNHPYYAASPTSPTVTTVTGTSAASSTVTVTTALPPPTITTASAITLAEAILNFTPPSGAAIGTTYTAVSGGTTYGTAAYPAVSINVTGLASNTIYSFSLSTTNTYGTSSLSSTVSVVTLPSAPTGLSAPVISDNGVSISVTPPTGTGIITQYVVTSSPGNISTSSSTSPVIVNGLSANTAYTFTVKATNASGTSVASTASNSVTTNSLPNPPTNLTASNISSSSATISFTPPVGTVTGYIITTNNGAQATGTSSPITITGLGGPYTYTITAVSVNLNGKSVNSSSITFTTPNPTASASGGTMTQYNGYNFHTFTSNGTFTIENSINSLSVLIVAGGGGGGNPNGIEGAGGGGGGGVGIGTIPLSSGSLSVTVGTGGVISTGTTYTTTAKGGNASITGSGINEIAYGGGGGSPGCSGANGSSGGSGGGGSGCGGAQSGSAGTRGSGALTYYGNGGGTGGHVAGGGGGGGSGSIGGTTTSSTAGTATGGAGTLWSVNGNYYGGGGGGGSINTTRGNGGSGGGGGGGTTNAVSIAGTINTGGGGGGSASSGTGITGAVGGSGVVIISYISVGIGGSSVTTNTGIPVQPTIGTVVAANTSITVNFSPPINVTTGSTYTIYYGNTVYGTAVYPATSIVASGLTPNTQYSFYVTATNTFGTSLPTVVIGSFTISDPPIITTVTNISGTTAVINFTIPNTITSGTTYSAVSGGTTYGTAAYPAVSINISGLSYNTIYSFSLTATNTYRTSQLSSPTTITTLPGPLQSLALSAYSDTVIQVSFAPSTGNATITNYSVSSTLGSISVNGITSPFTIVGLVANTTYPLTISSTNSQGTSSVVASITTKTLPISPTNLSLLSVTSASATIGFVPTLGQISYYVATTNTGITSFSVTSPIAISGLNPLTTYTINVQTVDAYGTSAVPSSIIVTTNVASTVATNYPATSLTFDANYNVISSSNLVSSWGDVSNAYFAVQSNNAYKPTIATNYMNALNSVVYNATAGQIVTTGSLGLGTISSLTLFFVMKIVSNTSVQNYFSSSGPSTTGSLQLVLNGSGYFQISLNAYEVNFSTNVAVPINSPFVLMVNVSSTEFTTSYLRLNGVNSATFVHNPFATTLNTGAFDFGGWTEGNRTINGAIGQIMIYNRTLSLDEIKRAEYYLSTRWNIIVADTILTAPVIGTVSSILSSSAVISFTAPPNASSGTVYTATASSKNYGTVAYPATTILLGNLAANTTYSFRITATNIHGTSPPSSALVFSTAPSVPIVTVITSSTNSITVSFPPSSGANAVTYSSSVGTGSGSPTSFVIAGLAPVTTYTFTIVATNSGGTTVSSNVTYTTALPAPTNVYSGSVSKNGATIYFTAPVQVTSTTSFALYISGISLGTVNYPTTSFALQGLVPNTIYPITVRSVTMFGTSLDSTILYVTTLPNAPANVTLIGTTSSTITVRFDDPVGNADIGYSSTFGTSYGVPTAYIVTGLTSNTRYTFAIIATNSAGSAISSTITVTTYILPPTGLITSSITANSLIVTFTPSYGATNGTTYAVGSSGTDYGTAAYPATTINVAGLSSNTSYTLTMTATNANGTSEASAPVSVLTAPPPPTSLVASALTNTVASISFTPPSGTITGYTVTSSPGSLTGTGTSSPINVGGLVPSTAYTFTMTAANSQGSSTPSSSSNSTTTNALPSPPTNLAGTASTASSITISFTPPLGTINSYLYNAVDSSSNVVTGNFAAPATTYTINGLLLGRAYTITLQSVDTYGTSTPSSSTVYSTIRYTIVTASLVINLDSTVGISGNTWTDQTGNGYNYNFYNNSNALTNLTTVTVNGYTAVSLSASNYLWRSNASGFDTNFKNSFTYEMWVYPTSTKNATLIYENGQNGFGGWADDQLGISSAGYFTSYVFNGGLIATGNAASAYTLNRWYQVANVYDNTAKVLYQYINGALAAQKSISKSYPGTVWLVLGAQAGNGSSYMSGLGYFLGYMGSFRGYNIPLSADQVLQNYNAFKTLRYI